MPVTLHPAVWSKVYDNPKVAKAAWDAGKDFKILDGPYCSKRDRELLVKQYAKIVIEYKPGHFLEV